MWKIPKPNITAIDSFDTCIAGIRDDALKNRLKSVRPNIVAAEIAFDAAASNVDLHEIVSETNIAGSVTAKEMKSLYDRHMARNGSRGYAIYDKLMIAAPDDRCPFCGHRNVSTLDHSLPKAQHPSLAVTPINLIPSCKDCNHTKGNAALSGKTDQLLNAYFDNAITEMWLFAEIVEGSPAAIRFLVETPEHWDDTMSARVRYHFAQLELAQLYASQGGRQLRNMRGALQDFYDAGGEAAVRADLWRRHTSYSAVEINTWETALYQAAAASDWYCDGGFSA